jgi:hypothetical protein
MMIPKKRRKFNRCSLMKSIINKRLRRKRQMSLNHSQRSLAMSMKDKRLMRSQPTQMLRIKLLNQRINKSSRTKIVASTTIEATTTSEETDLLVASIEGTLVESIAVTEVRCAVSTVEATTEVTVETSVAASEVIEETSEVASEEIAETSEEDIEGEESSKAVVVGEAILTGMPRVSIQIRRTRAEPMRS